MKARCCSLVLCTGPEDMRKIQAQRKMNQQHAQVEEVIGIMHKNVEAV